MRPETTGAFDEENNIQNNHTEIKKRKTKITSRMNSFEAASSAFALWKGLGEGTPPLSPALITSWSIASERSCRRWSRCFRGEGAGKWRGSGNEGPLKGRWFGPHGTCFMGYEDSGPGLFVDHWALLRLTGFTPEHVGNEHWRLILNTIFFLKKKLLIG